MSKALIISRKYSNLFRPEKTSYLTGNVGDVIDCEIQYEVTIDSKSSFGNTYTTSKGDRITRTTGSWYDEGFAEGQSLKIDFDLITPTTPPAIPVALTFLYTADIKTLTPSVMILENILLNGTTPSALINISAPYKADTYEVSEMRIASVSTVQGIDFEYGLVTNSQTRSSNATSLIDGSTTRFQHLSVNATNGTPLNLVPIGEESGASILSATIKGLGMNGNIQSFQIDIKYLITPLWESLTDIQTPSLPSFYKDKECIADVFNIKMLPQSGNPNISVSTSSSETQLLGNTGFFEENYNGKKNNYSVDSYLLTAGGFPVSGIQTSGETVFTIVINDPTNTASSKYKMGFVWSPDDDSLFQNNFYSNHKNLMYNGLDDSNALVPTTTPVTYNGTQNSTGAAMDIELISLTRSGSLVTLQGKFKPNATFTTFMDGQLTSDQNYLIWVSVGDPDPVLTTNISDRVSLIIDAGEFTQEQLSLQNWDITNTFLEHAQPAEQVGVGTYIGCTEDEILARGIIKLDTSKNETIQEITFTIEGYNSITLESYVLESNTYDTSAFVKDANGVQQIALDERRGFLMADGVDKDFVKVFRSPIDDSGNIVGYRSLYAFRSRWEDWLSNSNVPSSFYDNTQLNNALNNNWATKDDPANWDLTFNILLKVESQGEIINTKNRFLFSIKDYEESNVWDGEIELFNEAKTTSTFVGLNADGIRQNVILPNEKTFVQADFELEDITADVGDISNYFGVIRIEEYRNGGLFKIHMLSTHLKNITSGNLLLPLVGLTQTKITKESSTKIRLECFIDNTQLNFSAGQYKITARIGCGGEDAGKYSQHYSLKYD